jgi:RNase P subunit RPR2
MVHRRDSLTSILTDRSKGVKYISIFDLEESMKIAFKRVYCPACQKLVAGKEQKVNADLQILCGKCNRLLYSWNGLQWKVAGKKAK